MSEEKNSRITIAADADLDGEDEVEEATREVAIMDIPSPPEGLALPPLPIRAMATRAESTFNLAATAEYSPELHASLQEELASGSDTPREEPFPGLNMRAVPSMNLNETSLTDLHLSAVDTALFFNVDGSHSMEQILEQMDEPRGNRLLGLLFELWRAGFVTFETPTE